MVTFKVQRNAVIASDWVSKSISTSKRDLRPYHLDTIEVGTKLGKHKDKNATT